MPFPAQHSHSNRAGPQNLSVGQTLASALFRKLLPRGNHHIGLRHLSPLGGVGLTVAAVVPPRRGCALVIGFALSPMPLSVSPPSPPLPSRWRARATASPSVAWRPPRCLEPDLPAGRARGAVCGVRAEGIGSVSMSAGASSGAVPGVMAAAGCWGPPVGVGWRRWCEGVLSCQAVIEDW